MAENFDLIFGQNASQQYAWSDNDYQKGWETIGNIPPTAAQFDALQRRSDTKLKELNDELTPLVNADTADSRQPSTTYNEGDIKYSSLLPTGWFLTCTTAGTTSTSELVLQTPIAEGDTVIDGTVTWKIKKIGSGSGSGRNVGDIFLHAGNGENPIGALLCDGSAVSRTMYPDLFEKIGTTYGAGDGSTTFNLPNLSDNRFVEGSTTAGNVKSAGLPNITGGGKTEIGPNSVPTGAFYKIGTGSSSYTGGSNFHDFNLGFDASLSNPIYGNSNTVQPKSLTLRYFIQAFDGQTPDSALIDITQYAQELATKANCQLSNLDTANLACHVVVDSYYDDTTGDWWREYDDGWLEQGGKITPSATGIYTISFLKPMNDTSYMPYISFDSTYTDTWAPGYVSPTSRTTTTMNIAVRIGIAYNGTWSVCGMGAK